jgi:hypothetical protein
MALVLSQVQGFLTERGEGAGSVSCDHRPRSGAFSEGDVPSRIGVRGVQSQGFKVEGLGVKV